MKKEELKVSDAYGLFLIDVCEQFEGEEKASKSHLAGLIAASSVVYAHAIRDTRKFKGMSIESIAIWMAEESVKTAGDVMDEVSKKLGGLA